MTDRSWFRAAAAAATVVGVLVAQAFLAAPATATPDDQSSTPAAPAAPPADVGPAAEETPPAAAESEPAPTDDPATIADPAAPPELSIAIDNGRTATTSGDRLDYTITVQNIGTTDVEGLRVSQTQPDGLRFESADGGGTAQSGAVLWTVDIPRGTTGTVHTTMTVLATPDDLLRLATVACVRTAADAPPIVCAAHSDQLPAGAEVEARQASMTAEEPAPIDMRWYIGGAIAALTVVVVVFTVLWIRSRRRALAEEAGRSGPQQERERLVDTRLP
jgi:uncharacterized repeat protein (TIGR01451 family)